MSIRSKILAGFLALTILTGLLGAFAQDAERRLGALALDIYDNAFMAVSYLREAQIDFSRLAAAARGAGPPRLAPAATERELLDDLDVVRDRAMSSSGREQAIALKQQISALLPRLAKNPAAVASTQAAFDRLVETLADDGFRYRRRVGRLVAAQVHRTWAAIAASVVLALAITALITHLIAPPVRRAVRIAQSIAAGRLDNPIATEGGGETADLMRALSVMQASIASAMAQIQALMADQAASHASEIAAQHAKMEAALANMNQGLCLFSGDGRLAVSNRRFADMFGPPRLGDPFEAVLRAAGLAALLDISRDGAVETFACDLSDGRSIAVSQQAIAGGGWVATYEDVTERRAAEQRLAHMARHDRLTGLPNQLRFNEQMRQLLSAAGPDGTAAVLRIDLERFKPVNDMLGHPVGNALLQAAAARLRDCAGPCNPVFRLDGAAFAILQEAPAQPTETSALAQRVIAALSEPFQIGPHQIVIGACAGIASSRDGADGETILQHADLASQRARSDGPGSFHFFEAEMNTRVQARRVLEQDLRRALAEEQFELFFQPLIKSGAGVFGFEALLRWRHPVRGLVSPAVFIPLAEEMDLIAAIGTWALHRACAEAASWPADLKVAVNLSPLQFRGRLAEDVANVLRASGLPPQRLELEITESVLLQDDEKVLATLHAIRSLGVGIAMDDFGTGYSSLGYLNRFPFDKIKIDQSFVRGMTEQEDCLAIVRAVIGLGRSLGVAVLAEGVETAAQHTALLDEGCTELQGYLFSAPRPARSVHDMLRELEGASTMSDFVRS